MKPEDLKTYSALYDKVLKEPKFIVAVLTVVLVFLLYEFVFPEIAKREQESYSATIEDKRLIATLTAQLESQRLQSKDRDKPTMQQIIDALDIPAWVKVFIPIEDTVRLVVINRVYSIEFDVPYVADGMTASELYQRRTDLSEKEKLDLERYRLNDLITLQNNRCMSFEEPVYRVGKRREIAKIIKCPIVVGSTSYVFGRLN